MLSNLLNISLQRTDSMADAPAIHLQFCLAGTARSNSSAKPGKVISITSQTRKPIFQLCQLDLKLAFLCARAARENVQDQTCTVDNFGIECVLQVLRLTRRKLV